MAAAEVILAHDIPVAFGDARSPDADVLVRGRRAGRGGGRSSSPPATTRGPTTASRSRLRPALRADRTCSRSSRRRSPRERPVERRPFADAEAAGLVERYDPYEGYERYVRRTVDLDALKAADIDVLVEPMWGAGAGWLSRLLGGGRIRVNEIHQERNPYFGGVNPEPIRPNIDEALTQDRPRRPRARAAARR